MGRGHKRLRVRGWGSPNSDDKLSTLPNVWYLPSALSWAIRPVTSRASRAMSRAVDLILEPGSNWFRHRTPRPKVGEERRWVSHSCLARPTPPPTKKPALTTFLN
jgi:hypothetical protein